MKEQIVIQQVDPMSQEGLRDFHRLVAEVEVPRQDNYEQWAWKWSNMEDHVRASRCMAGCRDSRQLNVYSLGLLRGRIPIE